MLSGSSRIKRLRARNKVHTEARAAVALKAVGYLRVSTEEQATQGFGLAAQERAVRAFAESQGYELVELAADPGVSGATRPAERPGFGRVLELATERRFAVLLVYRFDRLARAIGYAVTTVNDLSGAGVMLRSVTEPIDTVSPAGKMMFAVFAAMAEAERDTIGERTKGGKIQKALKGGFTGGRVPYGYERDGAKGIRPREDQARIVRRIIRARKRKETLQAIADGLNAEGVSPPSGRLWRPNTVAYVADNPVYRGAVERLFRSGAAETHVLEEGAHAAII